MPTSTRDYLLSYEGAERDAVEGTCTAALSAVRPRARRSWVSDRTDIPASLSVRARRARQALVSLSPAGGDTSHELREIDSHDDAWWNVLLDFAPWCTRLLLTASPAAAAGEDILLIEDAGRLIAARLPEPDSWVLDTARQQGYRVLPDDAHLSQRRASPDGPTLSSWEFTQATAASFLGQDLGQAHELARAAALQLRTVDQDRAGEFFLTADLRHDRVTLHLKAGRVVSADPG